MRRALLVATDRYVDPTFSALRSPRRDVAELDRVLRDPAIGGFTTEVLINQSSGHLRERVEVAFGGAGHDDFLLLYLSGHGVKDRFGRLQFVATDTRNERVASSAVAAQFVHDLIDQSRASQVVVWLDCCYGGAFPSGMLPRAAGSVDVVEQLEGRGCVVMTASTHIQYAYEPGGGVANGRPEPSVFTKAIVEGLQTGVADLDGDGEITTGELYSYVYDRVRAENPEQTPTSSGTVSGDLVVAHAGSRLPFGGPDELRRLLRSRDPALREAGVRILAERAGGGDVEAAEALRLVEPGSDVVVKPSRTPPSVKTPGEVVLGGFVRCAELPDGASTVAFSPDSGMFASGEWVWDTRTWQRLHHVEDGAAPVFSPDGRLLAVGRLATVMLLSTSTWAEVARLDCPPEGLDELGFTHDGRSVLWRGGGLWRVWTVLNGSWRHRGYGYNQVCISAGSPQLAKLRTEGVELLDTSDPGVWRTLHTFRVSGARAMALSPDGRLLAISEPEKTTVWRTTDRAALRTLPVGVDAFDAPVFGPDNRTLVVPTRSGLKLYDAVKGTVTQTLPTQLDRVAFSPDGRLVAAGHRHGYFGRAWVWARDPGDLDGLSAGKPPLSSVDQDHEVWVSLRPSVAGVVAAVVGFVATLVVVGWSWLMALLALVVAVGLFVVTRSVVKRAWPS
ncbi:caspase, EACC1-associated type [Actinosynnema sp. CS-041913]|uniref:caspase, EACC1-associated type n=1 Tax=Actinosynnema sp. CS-041913 TaxID=3239917 RepID=UPI003D93029B